MGTAGSAAYGTGAAYGFSAADSAGQVLKSAGSGTPAWGSVALSETSGSLGLGSDGTGSDLSATGGAGRVLKQTTFGGSVTVATLDAGDLPTHSHSASQISSGTLADARLSANVPRLDAAQTFSATQTFSGQAGFIGTVNLTSALSLSAAASLTVNSGATTTFNNTVAFGSTTPFSVPAGTGVIANLRSTFATSVTSTTNATNATKASKITGYTYGLVDPASCRVSALGNPIDGSPGKDCRECEQDLGGRAVQPPLEGAIAS